MAVSDSKKHVTTSSGKMNLDKAETLQETSGIVFGPDAPQDNQDSQDPYDLYRQTKNNNGSSRALSRNLLSLPLEEYLKITIEFCRQLREEQSEDAWRSPLFNFARFCKAHPTIADLPDDEAMQLVEEVMSTYFDVPRGVDPWEYFFPEGEDGEILSGDDSRIDFMSSWASVRHVPFRDALHSAFRLAEQRPLVAPRRRAKLYDQFISLAVWLQRLRCEYVIYLPTRAIAELLDCDQRTVSRLRKLAVQDGLLRIVREHRFRSTGKSEATEFRVAIERFEDPGGEQ